MDDVYYCSMCELNAPETAVSLNLSCFVAVIEIPSHHSDGGAVDVAASWVVRRLASDATKSHQKRNYNDAKTSAHSLNRTGDLLMDREIRVRRCTTKPSGRISDHGGFCIVYIVLLNGLSESTTRYGRKIESNGSMSSRDVSTTSRSH